ncbi:MDR family oxidoreductase [Burkholderia multivorans]|uniref:acrylyl-CoA reductase (NADPH) n=1 Tax=Burkholderia multivorans TaxID=87883 RepID=UPI0021BED108|nr:MDR family oxidoreductase [Burkholderia multivorans]
MFRGIVVNKDESGYRAALEEIAVSQLSDGDVTVKIAWSTLNYKDGLAITGRSPVVRSFPLVPGIDFAGTVVDSNHPNWKVGDRVVLNGWGVGEVHWGGFAEFARVSGDWLISHPDKMNLRQSMAIGTAGYTAMLAILALEGHGIKPDDGEVLVTGASGGVGSVAIALLCGLGYRIVASTGRVSEAPYLMALGAQSVVDRIELGVPGKPLGKERWAGVIDSVGSYTLANACATTRRGGAVALCGLAGGMDFPSTVAPFILRGITLYGIDSVMTSTARRRVAWQRLAQLMDVAKLDLIANEISLTEVQSYAEKILAGEVRGRLVVKVAND